MYVLIHLIPYRYVISQVDSIIIFNLQIRKQSPIGLIYRKSHISDSNIVNLAPEPLLLTTVFKR